jgi:hypothetical protein
LLNRDRDDGIYLSAVVKKLSSNRDTVGRCTTLNASLSSSDCRVLLTNRMSAALCNACVSHNILPVKSVTSSLDCASVIFAGCTWQIDAACEKDDPTLGHLVEINV